MASTSSSLVLGFAAGLRPSFLDPFVKSLRATGYRGRLGLVLAHYDAQAQAQLERHADVVLNVGARYADGPDPRLVSALRRLRATRGARRAYPLAFELAAAAGPERASQSRWEALEFHLEGLQALRYGHYYEFIRELAADANQVLLTDLRDVVFQDDPFTRPLAGLEVFLEDPSHTIAAETFNRRWIQNLYGPGRLEVLAAKTVSCSGTVVGTREAILHYLKEMSEAITWRRRPLGPHDQGVHNHLLRSGRLGQVTVVPNGHGRVLTMGGMKEVIRDEGGWVLNADGSVPAVLHQYDRHRRLAEELFTRFGTNAA